MKNILGAMIAATLLFFVSVGCDAVPDGPAGTGTVTVAGMTTTVPEGLSGVLKGGVIGDYAVDQKRSAAETFHLYHYQAQAGILVQIESHIVEPYTVGSGGTVEILTTYVVMAPDAATPVNVTESHEIRQGKELVGNLTLKTSLNSGTYGSSVPLSLPGKTPADTYQVITTIRTDAGSDSRQTTFVVM